MLSEQIHSVNSNRTVVQKDIHITKYLKIISEIVDKVNPRFGKTANKLRGSQQLAFFVGINPVITIPCSGGVR